MTASVGDQRVRAARLIHSFDTVEDFGPKMEKLVTAAGFLTVENPTYGGNETLTPRGGEVIHYYRDPQSASGWGQHKLALEGAPAGAAIRSLVAFYQDGYLYLIATYPIDRENLRAIAARREKDGRWTPDPFPALRESLASVRKVDVYRGRNGRHFLYGMSVSGQQAALFAGYQDAAGGAWRTVFQNPLSEIAKRPQQWTMVNALAPDEFYWMRMEDDASGYAGSPRFFIRGCKWNGPELAFSGEDRRVFLNISHTRSETARVFPIPASNGARGIFVQTANRELFYIAAYDTNGVVAENWNGSGGKMPNAAESIGVTVLRSQPSHPCVIFARDGNKNLWIRRQRGVAHTAVFDPWVNLGSSAELLACPPDAEAACVTLVNAAGIVQMVQDPSNGSWRDSLLQAPIPSATEFEKYTAHALILQAVDGNGGSVRDTALQLYTKTPTALTVNGRTVVCNNSQPLPVRTDDSGRVTIRSRAWNLSAAPVEVHVPDFMAEGQRAQYSPDLTLCRRLAGHDSNFRIDGAELKNRGLVSRTMSEEDTAKVVGFVKRAGQAMGATQSASLNFDSEILGGPLADAGWEFTFQSPGNVGVRELSLSEILASSAAAPAGVDAANLPSFFGDLVRFLKNTWDKVVKITVTFVKDVLEVAFRTIDELYNMTVRAASDIADTLVATLKKLGAAVRDAGAAVLDWLQTLFSWNDIMNTKRVIRRCADHLFDAILHSVEEDGQKLVVDTFGKLRSQSRSQILRIREALGARSITQLAGERGQGDLTRPPVRTMAEGQAVRCGYIQERIADPNTKEPAAAVLAAQDLQAIEGLIEDIKKLLNDPELTKTLDRFRDEIMEMMGSGDFAKLLNSSVGALLTLVEAVVDGALKLVETVLRAFLRLVATLITAIRKILEAPWEIPVLTPLYNSLSRPDLGDKGLSLMEVAALAMAVPGTVIHKLMRNGEAPFTETQVKEVLAVRLPFRGIVDLIKGAPATVSTDEQRVWRMVLFAFDIPTTLALLAAAEATAFGDALSIYGNRLGAIFGTVSFACNLLARACGVPWLVNFYLKPDKTPLDFIRLSINLGGWLSVLFAGLGVLAGGDIAGVFVLLSALLATCMLILGLVLLVDSIPGGELQPILAGILSVGTPLTPMVRGLRPFATVLPPATPPYVKEAMTTVVCASSPLGAWVCGGLRIASGASGAFVTGA